MTEKDMKREAVRLLRKYDKLKREMLTLEHEAKTACANYGRAIGVYGYRIDHLRMQVEREKGKVA